jgi:hypothetical protein
MSNQTATPTATQNIQTVPLRGCGIRYGIYLVTDEVGISDKEKSKHLIDPIQLCDEATWEGLGICAQGQTFAMIGNQKVIIDVVGNDGYCPADFIVEAWQKGTSNRLRQIPDGLTQEQQHKFLTAWFSGYELEMPILYLSSRAYIKSEYRHLYYKDRQNKLLTFGSGKACIMNLPDHQMDVLPYTTEDDILAHDGEYPMCASLLFEDLPRPEGRYEKRVIQRAVGDITYYGGCSPRGKIERTWGFFYKSFVSAFEVVYPDDAQKAEETANLLSGIGLNVPVYVREN